MTEYLDYYDTDMNFLGKATREDVHAQGLWHKTVHCWLYDDLGYVYFQMRAEAPFSNRLYTTASGHIQAGETINDAFIRETKEELGLDITNVSLEQLGIIRWQNHTPDKNDNVFCNLCIGKISTLLPSFKFDETEVNGVIKVSARDCIKLMRGEYNTIAGVEITNKKIIPTNITVKDFLLANEREIPLVKYGMVLQAIENKTKVEWEL